MSNAMLEMVLWCSASLNKLNEVLYDEFTFNARYDELVIEVNVAVRRLLQALQEGRPAREAAEQALAVSLALQEHLTHSEHLSQVTARAFRIDDFVYALQAVRQQLLERGGGVAAKVSAVSEQQRCPFCREPFGAEPEMVCSVCGTKVHLGCAEELRRCTTLGCKGGWIPFLASRV